jgi:phosphoketolase
MFDALSTPDKPVLFAYHGYPRPIHRLTYRRHNDASAPSTRVASEEVVAGFATSTA